MEKKINKVAIILSATFILSVLGLMCNILTPILSVISVGSLSFLFMIINALNNNL